AAQAVRLLARVEVRPRGAVDRRAHRKPARLARDVGGDRQQLLRLVLEGLGALAPDATAVDAPLEVRELAARVDLRVAPRDAPHARRRFLVAAGAGLLLRPRGLAPQLLSTLDPQRRRVRELVLLQRDQVGAEKSRAGFQLGERYRPLLGERGERDERERQ